MEGGDLLVLAFFVAWVLGSVLKMGGAGRRRPTGSQPAPGPRRFPEAEAAGAPARPSPAGSRSSAEDLIPAELWEVLTGERRPAPVAWEPYEEAEDAEEELPEAVSLETTQEEAFSLERPVNREIPRVVSMEEDLPSPAARHAAFHARIDAAAAPRRTPRSRPILGGPEALRRSIVLSEVLGPPKALEE